MSDSEDTEDLSAEIAEKWDPERLLRMVAGRAGKGEKLDEVTRSKYERRIGADFSKVRVYTGEFAQSVAKRHNAEAVTIGGTGMIMMGGLSERAPTSTAGRALLAHELTHVAQSQRGLHRSATMGDSPALATDEHEQEAAAAEQQEHAESGAAGGPTEGDKLQAQQKAREAIIDRVLEMLAEHERVNVIRTGDDPFQP